MDNQLIKELTPSAILAFAQSLCPKIHKILVAGNCYEPYVFGTVRGAKILAPVVHFGNHFGFRSFLQVTGKRSCYILNGQASTGTKSLCFFGENGPFLVYRDSDIEPKTVWGVPVDPKLPAFMAKLKEQDTAEAALTYVVSTLPSGWPLNRAISSILHQARIPVKDGVSLVLRHTEGLAGLEALRMVYKSRSALMEALRSHGIDLGACLFQWRNCEYPQSIARELAVMGMDSAEIFSMIEAAYADSERFEIDHFRGIFSEVLA